MERICKGKFWCLHLSSKTFCLVLCCAASTIARADDNLDKADVSFASASQTIKEIQARESQPLLPLLQAMKGKTKTVKNWYLSAAQSVADKAPDASREQLEEFLTRLSEDADARYWAFRFVTRGRPELRKEILRSMQADPSLELRYESVKLALSQLESDALSEDQQKAAYESLLAAARLPSQVQEIAGKLEDLGVEIDLLKHFGFISQWSSVGPFDNPELKGFSTVYSPEQEYLSGKLDLQAAKYAGKHGSVSWNSIGTKAADGAVNLAEAYEKEKRAVVYALGRFVSEDSRSSQLRIGSPNAVKVWVNGQLVIERNVYHSGSQMDQYQATVELKKGINTILIKSCQNEQTEPWAQDYQYQIRFTDETGLALRSGE